MNKRFKVIYISHPYSGDIEGNREKVRRFCDRVKGSCIPVAVHLFLHQYIDEETERLLAMDHAKQLLRVCDEVWVLTDEISVGMQEEIDYAKKCRKVIVMPEKLRLRKIIV